MLRLAAGLCLAGAIRRLEAGATGTALGGVGVEDGEPTLHEVFDVVYFGAVEERGALFVNNDGDAVDVERDVAFFDLARDGHAVLVAGAAAADNEHPEGAAHDVALSQELLGLFGRLVGYGYEGLGLKSHQPAPCRKG